MADRLRVLAGVDERGGQLLARADIVGIQLAGDPELLDGALMFAPIDEAQTEVHVGVRVVELHADRGQVLLHRHVLGLG